MSSLTASLIGVDRASPDAPNWRRRFRAIQRRLVSAYGRPRLGNFRDPVREVFYIVLSARTTDEQYRETERRLHASFPTLVELAVGRIDRIRRCITSGGLAILIADERHYRLVPADQISMTDLRSMEGT